MNILFLSNAYPDFDSSYRGIFIKRMAELLHEEGYEIFIITPKIFRRSHFFEDQGGIKVYRFPFLARDKLLIEHKRIPYFRMFLYYLTGFFITIYVILKMRCKLIHVHWVIPIGLIGVWVGRLFKKSIILTIHGSDLRMAMERGGILKRIFGLVCRNAYHINCVSEVQREKIEALGISKDKISVFPMGIDEEFLNTGLRRSVKANNNSFIIISNRNLIPIYNISLLIRAIPIILKEVEGVKFIIAGDGSDRERLQREVKNLNLGDSVKFTGKVPHNEMPDLLAQSDIYVSTSLYDGTSVSLLEAMASGCFPVVSDIPSNREWIRDGENGFLFPVDDENILAQKIINSIRDQSMRKKCIEDNLKIIKEKALWSVYINMIKEIYKTKLPK